MAKEPEQYRLWQHDVKPPKKSEQVVIAKVTSVAATPTRTPESAMSTGGRAARAAGVTAESGLARLLDNGHVARIRNVFDEGDGGGARALAMFAGGAGGGRAAK